MKEIPLTRSVRLKPDATEMVRSDTLPPKLTARRRDNPWIRRSLVLLACVILLDSLFGDRGLAQTMRARRDHRRAVADLERLERENASLRDEMHRLSGDPAAIEAVARQELGLIAPGEILVVLRDVK
jgi:cell division protein FtsB